ncbi:MAG TPA: hypothetical protein VJ577_16865 [Burkholderiaceae bacterium]|nr:hypothetical protein [Burkholderiaceae bacterium]
MNWIINLLSDPLKQFALSNPALALALAAAATLPVVWFASWRLMYAMREKSLNFSDKRLSWLMETLKIERLEAIHPLRLELVFRRAYGYRYNSDEIRLAMARKNTSGLLFDIRYGVSFVRLNKASTGFEVKKEHVLSLQTRERIADWIAQLIFIPAILFSFIFSFLWPVEGIFALVESVVFFVVFMGMSRSLACAQRLLTLDRYPLIVTEKGSEIAPLPIEPPTPQPRQNRARRNKIISIASGEQKDIVKDATLGKISDSALN